MYCAPNLWYDENTEFFELVSQNHEVSIRNKYLMSLYVAMSIMKGSECDFEDGIENFRFFPIFHLVQKSALLYNVNVKNLQIYKKSREEAL